MNLPPECACLLVFIGLPVRDLFFKIDELLHINMSITIFVRLAEEIKNTMLSVYLTQTDVTILVSVQLLVGLLLLHSRQRGQGKECQ